MAEVARKQRKRNVVGELKALAAELGCERKRQLDLSKDEFVSFHTALTAASRTPEHRQKFDSAWQSFVSGAELPPLPSLPSLGPPAEASAATSSVEADGTFRLRATACLFTWNSESFARMVPDQLWADFLGWLKGLAFIICWTATLENLWRCHACFFCASVASSAV